MAISPVRIVASAKTKLAALLEAAGLSPSDAEEAAEKAIDNLGVAIIEAVVEDLQSNGETSGGDTIL